MVMGRNQFLFFVFMSVLLTWDAAWSEELGYDDLLRELNLKRNRLTKLNTKNSLAQNYLSLGIVGSVNQVGTSQGRYQSWMHGFDLGYSSDLGSTDLEGRAHFRYFFQQNDTQVKVGAQELNAQVVSLNPLSPRWKWTAGGGVSLRHLMLEEKNRSHGELSIQLNGVAGLETSLSATSRLALELGTRFPLGVTGQDQFSLDTSIKLKTEIE